VKVCPECRYQFSDAQEFCPTHGKRLTAMTIFLAPGQAGPGAATVFYNPHQQQPQESYERLIGTVLDGRYILMEKMGEGGMGVVFKARHTVIEKIVAVKILKREVARDRAVLQRFVQEAKAASRIGHPSIVDVTDFGTLPDGSAYQVMEFIAGVTLARAIKQGPMWAARALPIVGQIARALGAAHEKGIVHRDLKPDNIFLVEKNGIRDLVRIVDFGVAKFAPMGNVDGPRLTRAGAVFGTPEYMAPEQAAGRSDNDHRVDVYALGTILYEMLVGRVPHKGETIVATLAQQMLDPIIPPRRMNPRADVTDRLEQVIMTAVAKDRDRRYQSMADFWVGLEWAAVELGVVIDIGTMSVDMPGLSTPQGLSTFDAHFGGHHGGWSAHARQGLGGPTVPDARESAMLEAEAAAAGARARGRRLTFAALGVVSIAAATLGIAFAVKSNKGTLGEDAGIVAVPLSSPDATAVVQAPSPPDARAPDPPDAAVVVEAAEIDAGVEDEASDAEVVAAAETDGSRRLTPDRTPTEVVRGGPNHEIVVSTKPGGGSLYVGGLAAGTDGTTFRRGRGTRLDVRCLFPGNDRWEPGRLSLVFDGRTTHAECRLTRRTRCVKDLHNPFRNCPD
jgi:tRNA A-37 threonylcarbamoyl transferase component Bud32